MDQDCMILHQAMNRRQLPQQLPASAKNMRTPSRFQLRVVVGDTNNYPNNDPILKGLHTPQSVFVAG